MPIRDEIAGLSGLQRRRLKAQRLAEHAASRLPITWRLGAGARAADITISAASYDGEALRLRVSATRGGQTKADTLIIVNPPIMAPDGGTTTNEDGVVVATYREDAAAAIRAVVEDVVRGWG